jgi:hypothetical protein
MGASLVNLNNAIWCAAKKHPLKPLVDSKLPDRDCHERDGSFAKKRRLKHVFDWQRFA